MFRQLKKSVFAHKSYAALPVYIAQLVNGVHSKDDLCSIEPGPLLWYDLILADEREEVSPRVVLHHQVLEREGGTDKDSHKVQK